jgi:LysR family glycine cleavage system transcriptional activator
LKAHGVEAPAINATPIEFGHFFMSLEAARRDVGIAIIPQIIIAHYEHRLDLCSFNFNPINSAGEYYLLSHEAGVDDPDIQAVRRCIMTEAEKVRPLADSKLDLITANAAN